MLGTKASAFLQGASDERAFVVQYDADNFESNTPNNDKVKLQVPPPRLDELRRDSGTPEVVPLTLRLKTPCTIWRPRLDALVSAAKPSAEAFFNELVQLSKATTVRIAVNRKWQTDEYKNLLTVINSASEGFSGYPVARYYSNFFDKGDWTIFGPVNPIKRPRAGRLADTHNTSYLSCLHILSLSSIVATRLQTRQFEAVTDPRPDPLPN